MSDYPLASSDFKCDYQECHLLSFSEIFWHTKNDESGWCYLCLYHFIKEKIWLQINDFGWTLAEWLYRLPLVKFLWDKYASR